MIDRDSTARAAVVSRRVQWLPNALTTLALMCGFGAILQGIDGNAGGALVLLLGAGAFDAMDGRVARMTNAQSAFGVEYDSLSDMVCFGVAPALVCYETLLRGVGALGAFFFCACAAWRLARFNTRVGSADPRWFEGLPSPAGGILVMGYVWLATTLPSDVPSAWVDAGAVLVTLAGGLLMISSIRFPSGKKLGVPQLKLLAAAALVLAVVAAATGAPLAAIYAGFVLYCAAAPLRVLRTKATVPKRRRKDAG